jgi:hypothetical protein
MGFHYEHPPYAQFGDENQPLFFRRRYGGNPQPPEMYEGVVHFDLTPDVPIWIYGYSVASLYAEDREAERHAWQQRRSFQAWCYSVMCPTGEPGMVPLDAVEEITQEAFEIAAARSWE